MSWVPEDQLCFPETATVPRGREETAGLNLALVKGHMQLLIKVIIPLQSSGGEKRTLLFKDDSGFNVLGQVLSGRAEEPEHNPHRATAALELFDEVVLHGPPAIAAPPHPHQRAPGPCCGASPANFMIPLIVGKRCEAYLKMLSLTPLKRLCMSRVICLSKENPKKKTLKFCLFNTQVCLLVTASGFL